MNLLPCKLRIAVIVPWNSTVLTAMIKFWSKFYIRILGYSFTRDNRFLLTPSQSLPGKQESLSPAPLDTSTTALVCIFSSILNSIMEGSKFRSRELLRLFFITKQTIRKQTGSAWNFLQLSIQVCRGSYIPYFKNMAYGRGGFKGEGGRGGRTPPAFFAVTFKNNKQCY